MIMCWLNFNAHLNFSTVAFGIATNLLAAPSKECKLYHISSIRKKDPKQRNQIITSSACRHKIDCCGGWSCNHCCYVKAIVLWYINVISIMKLRMQKRSQAKQTQHDRHDILKGGKISLSWSKHMRDPRSAVVCELSCYMLLYVKR